MVRDQLLRLPDGRDLAFTDMGELGWPTVLFFHGAPTSRLHLSYLEGQLRARRVRVISPDRPGYGKSSTLPGRTLPAWADDVRALADALQLDRFVVAGHSSGGPYAVAAAALLPDRVLAAAVFDGVTDMGWNGAWDGCSQLEAWIMRMPNEKAAIQSCIERFGADGSGFDEVSDFEFTAPDRALHADEISGPAISSADAEAFRQGVIGYAQDIYVQGQPWTFDPRTIKVPTRILHGTSDNIVPLAHSRHTAELVAGSTLQVLEGHGHLSILKELPAISAELAASA